ncbi:MAG: helix-turn-helix domain-containing protein, partial [Chloroflexi bacterium]|nr:helix-turn-helix domain-containing protein [Chloroflexota bacterium]
RDLDGGRPGCIWRVQGGRLAVLVPLDGTGDLNQARTAIETARVNSQARLNGRTLSAGLGRFHAGPMGLRRAFREAEQALTIAQLLFGGDRLADFRDLGVFRLLFPLQGSTELRSFFDETLGALVHYDKKNNTELASTLETFFASRGNLQRTAEALFLHRNTLSYRLGRVEDLTGLDLDDAEDCFRLQLALKIGRIL